MERKYIMRILYFTSVRKNDSVVLMSTIGVFSKRKFVAMPTYKHRNKNYF
jgi:hypothetical protein